MLTKPHLPLMLAVTRIANARHCMIQHATKLAFLVFLLLNFIGIISITAAVMLIATASCCCKDTKTSLQESAMLSSRSQLIGGIFCCGPAWNLWPWTCSRAQTNRENTHSCIHPPRRYEHTVERIVSIDEIIVHPKYNWKENLNRDIALLHMKRPVKFTNEIHPVCLPNKKVASL